MDKIRSKSNRLDFQGSLRRAWKAGIPALEILQDEKEQRQEKDKKI
jgi:hypothetical protein